MEKLYSFLHVPEKTNITKNTKINNEQILGYITIVSAQNYIANLDSKINENDINSLLLRESKKSKNIIDPFLCLRCYVSFHISNYIKKIYSQNKKKGLSLSHMALISLKDNGSKLFRFQKLKEFDALIKTNKDLTELFKTNQSKNKNLYIIKNTYSNLMLLGRFFPIPLGIEIILSFKANKSSIKNWVFTKTRSDKTLAAYLKIYQVKIESKWTFLRYCPLKDFDSKFQFYKGQKSFSYMKDLFLSYKKIYEQEKSKIIIKIKWAPDNSFLEKLEPKQINIDLLEDLIDFLRTDTTSIYEEDYFHDISSEKKNANKKNVDKIKNANEVSFFESSKRKLNKHLVEIIDTRIIDIYPFYIEKKFSLKKDEFSKFPVLREIWLLWCDGYSTRKILNKIKNQFPECNQSFITRAIKEKEIYEDIAEILINRIVDKKNKKELRSSLEIAKNISNNDDIFLLEEKIELINFFNPLNDFKEKENVIKNIAIYIKMEFNKDIKNWIKKII